MLYYLLLHLQSSCLKLLLFLQVSTFRINTDVVPTTTNFSKGYDSNYTYNYQYVKESRT